MGASDNMFKLEVQVQWVISRQRLVLSEPFNSVEAVRETHRQPVGMSLHSHGACCRLA